MASESLNPDTLALQRSVVVWMMVNLRQVRVQVEAFGGSEQDPSTWRWGVVAEPFGGLVGDGAMVGPFATEAEAHQALRSIEDEVRRTAPLTPAQVRKALATVRRKDREIAPGLRLVASNGRRVRRNGHIKPP